MFAIPVIWIKREDLVLRNEVVTLFKKYELDTNDLVFKEDVNFDSFMKESLDIKVTLVDHNNKVCHPELTNFVTQIIDHHELSNDHDKAKLNIEMTGSCSTLITEEIYYNCRELLNLKPITDFLIAAILIDTINLDLYAGRTTEKDIFFAEVLLSFSNINPDVFFKELQDAKMNISSLSTYDILRKDYKQVHCNKNNSIQIGFSSATIHPTVFLVREDLETVSHNFMQKFNIDVLVIMFLCYSEEHIVQRYITVYTQSNVELKNKVLQGLINNRDKLSLCERNNMHEGLFQHGAQYSRKVVLPLVKEFDL